MLGPSLHDTAYLDREDDTPIDDLLDFENCPSMPEPGLPRRARRPARLAAEADRAIAAALYRVSQAVRKGHAKAGRYIADPLLSMSDVAEMAFAILAESGYSRRVIHDSLKARLAPTP